MLLAPDFFILIKHFFMLCVCPPLLFVREEIEKQKSKERYMKLHLEGKTEQARADLARLAIIKKQREDAAKKRDDLKKGERTQLLTHRLVKSKLDLLEGEIRNHIADLNIFSVLLNILSR